MASRSPASFDAPYGLPGSVGIGRLPRPAVPPLPAEDLVGRDDQQVRSALGTGRGKDTGRRAVAPDGQLGVEGTAVDVGPGRGVDDDLGPVAVEARADPVGCVEVERVALPGDRAGRAGEGSVGEGGDERAARGGRPLR